MKNLQLEYLIFSYTDDSGSINNVPRRGDEIETPLGKVSIVRFDILTRYADGGASPFTVELKTRLLSKVEK